jgi:C1A family cysteine protease
MKKLENILKNINVSCVQDKIDNRDFIYKITRKRIPKSINLAAGLSSPILQGSLNSCTACAFCSIIEYNIKEKKDPINGSGTISPSYLPSQLFLYYNERAEEGNIDKNAPVEIRDGIKAAVKYGVCNFEMWPYVIDNYAIKPPDIAFQTAKSCRALQYKSLKIDIGTLKDCLANGNPFVFGFALPKSFSKYPDPGGCSETGMMVMPDENEERMGGHAVAAFGYDDELKCFYVRNSWSEYWGKKGYFYMPYDFVTGSYNKNGEKQANTFSFWTISEMS